MLLACLFCLQKPPGSSVGLTQPVCDEAILIMQYNLCSYVNHL